MVGLSLDWGCYEYHLVESGSHLQKEGLLSWGSWWPYQRWQLLSGSAPVQNQEAWLWLISNESSGQSKFKKSRQCIPFYWDATALNLLVDLTKLGYLSHFAGFPRSLPLNLLVAWKTTLMITRLALMLLRKHTSCTKITLGHALNYLWLSSSVLHPIIEQC